MLEATILLYALVSEINLDRARNFFSSEIVELDHADYRHLVSRRFGCSINFFNDRRQPTFRLHSISILVDQFDSYDTRRIQARLNGKWISIPIELGDKDGAFPITISSPYSFAVDGKFMLIDYGLVCQRFLAQYTSAGPLLRASISFPMKKEFDSFIGSEGNDLGLLSQYYVVGNGIAVGWRPTSCRLGRLVICFRVQP